MAPLFSVCVLSILGAGFFTILYSMEWGPEKSADWLTTFLLSFFQSVIIIQPVKVCLQGPCWTWGPLFDPQFGQKFFYFDATTE